MLDEVFSVEEGQLVRRVTPRRGSPYEHRCLLATFEEVAHRIDELDGGSFVLTDLNSHRDLPWTQVAVALAFIKERGCIVPAHGRRHRAATRDVFLDAMTEFHALQAMVRPGSACSIEARARPGGPPPTGSPTS